MTIVEYRKEPLGETVALDTCTEYVPAKGNRVSIEDETYIVTDVRARAICEEAHKNPMPSITAWNFVVTLEKT